MPLDLQAGTFSRFPTIIWVDANDRNGGINLIFGTRIEGQAASVQITLTRPQWENLKFLVEGPKNDPSRSWRDGVART
jgi:hypothetical protein